MGDPVDSSKIPQDEKRDKVRFVVTKNILRWPRLSLFVAMFIDAIISLYWLGSFESEATDGKSSEANDWQILIKPLTWGITAVVLSWITLVLGLIPIRRHGSANVILSLLVLKFLHLIIDSVNIKMVDQAHWILGVFWIFLHVSEILHIILIVSVFGMYLRFQPRRDSVFATKETPTGEEGFETFFSNLEHWLSLLDDRRVMAKKVFNGRNYFLIISVLMLAMVYSNFAIEMIKMYTTEEPFFSENTLADMKWAPNSWPDDITYANFSHVQDRPRVFYIIIDGLRYDKSRENAAFNNFFWENETFLVDSKNWESICELPSMSVPNWVTLLTGSPPEMHGTLGNLLVPETKFDNIFRQAKEYGVFRGMTGSPWFSDIVETELPFLHGVGTIDTQTDPKDEDRSIGHKTAAPSDEIRGRLLMDAIQNPLDYQLFLAHFSDVDMQGHYYGVSHKYNKYDSYNTAITQKVEIIRRAIDAADNNSVFIITSDHGQVDRGGHGGIEDICMRIPLFIYQKGSNFSNFEYSGPRLHDGAKRVVRNMDLAATICIILGLPVPRQSNGRFIEDALFFVPKDKWLLHFQDVYFQQKLYVHNYLKQTKASDKRSHYDVFARGFRDWDAAAFARETNELMDIWDDQRGARLSYEGWRNVLMSFIVLPVLFIICLVVLQFGTAADPWGAICPWQYTIAKWWNLQAFTVTFVATFLFYCVNICLFLIIYRIIGYKHWDSTIVHEPMVVVKYIFITIVPACILSLVYVRSIQLPLSKRPRVAVRSCSKNPFLATGSFIHQIWTNLIIGTNDSVGHLPLLYLYKYYSLLHVVGSLLFMFTIQSMYTFILPEIWRIHYVTKGNWETRFRIFTCEMFAIPLSILCVVMLLVWPAAIPHKDNWDRVYLMWLKKSKKSLSGHLKRYLAEKVWKEDKKPAFWRLTDIPEKDRFRHCKAVGDLLGTFEGEYETDHLRPLGDGDEPAYLRMEDNSDGAYESPDYVSAIVPFQDHIVEEGSVHSGGDRSGSSNPIVSHSQELVESETEVGGGSDVDRQEANTQEDGDEKGDLIFIQ